MAILRTKIDTAFLFLPSFLFLELPGLAWVILKNWRRQKACREPFDREFWEKRSRVAILSYSYLSN